MPLVVNTNLASLNAQRNLGRTTQQLDRALTRLSSGLRINGAKDDAAGLAISERFTAQIRGLNQAVRNANDGTSLAQTAEGALQESVNLLQRLRELAVQSANDTNAGSDRQSIQDEVEQIKSELDRISSTTEFNGRKLLDGSAQNLQFHVGVRQSQTIAFSVKAAGSANLGNNSVTAVNTDANQGSGQARNATNNLSSTTNTIAAQTLTLSGGDGTANVSVAAGATASAIATSINAATASTGVSATATTTANVSGLTADGTVTFTLGSGSSTAVISAAVTTTDLTKLVEEINGRSGTTGVTAAINSGNASLTLTQADGKDIRIENFTSTGTGNQNINITGQGGDAVTLTEAGADSTVVSGVVTLNSADAFTAASNVANSAGSVLTNLAANVATSSTQSLVSAIDLTSQSGANSALTVIDSAISVIDKIRSGLGAIQNRFDATVTNLQNVTENVSAARSRVLDADFAAETSALTRGQILQQAGVAILAQANQVQQSILSLLQ